MTVDFSHSQADYGVLIAGLMGPMNGGDPPPAWPPDPDSAIRDEAQPGDPGRAPGPERRRLPGRDRHRRHLAGLAEVKGACALLGSALDRAGDQRSPARGAARPPTHGPTST